MKPNNNSIIPLMTGTEYLAVTSRLSNWASDSNGWNLNCAFAEAGWVQRQDESGNFLVNSPSGASSSGYIWRSDPFGATADETLDFTFDPTIYGYCCN